MFHVCSDVSYFEFQYQVNKIINAINMVFIVYNY